jgi:riboflavin kinase / FMN adenylyltransferase
MTSEKVLQGIVREGHKRGKQFGFPTINFPLTETVEEGIYASRIVISGQQYNGVTFIGTAKTFDETIFQAETYVLEFNQDVYGQTVTVTLLKKLRDNQKFGSVEELIKQMEEDTRQAQVYFASHK